MSSKSNSDSVNIFDASPFIITKFLSKHRIEIQHLKYDKFYLTAHYFGRSTFSVSLPKNWENHGLAGVGPDINGKYKLCHAQLNAV